MFFYKGPFDALPLVPPASLSPATLSTTRADNPDLKFSTYYQKKF